MVAYTFRMPAGIPGAISRTWNLITEGDVMDSANPVLAYGQATVLDSSTGKLRAVTSSDTTISGFVVRPFPISGQGSGGPFNLNYAFDQSVPPTSGVVDRLRMGYMTVKLNGTATAAKGAPVYVWVAASTGAHVQGGVEAAASSGNTIAVANATFTGAADANGNVEISYGIPG